MQQRIEEETLAPLVHAGARLLRVEAHAPNVWVLHFDRGALEVSAAGRALDLVLGPATPDIGAESLDETDPWWTVLGAPLAGAWSSTDTTGRRVSLELQLRRDDASPKRITLESRGPRLEARVLGDVH